jgi:hypothetical protein
MFETRILSDITHYYYTNFVCWDLIFSKSVVMAGLKLASLPHTSSLIRSEERNSAMKGEERGLAG